MCDFLPFEKGDSPDKQGIVEKLYINIFNLSRFEMLSNKLFLVLTLTTAIYATDDGSLLFNGNCITCHHPTKSISAPSMVEVRKNYLNAFSKKEDFIEYMSKWVKKPNEETSIMQYAVKKYGLMPELAFEMETLQEITSYIYNTDFIE